MKLHKFFGIAALVCLAGAVVTGCQMRADKKDQELACEGAGCDEDLDFAEEPEEAQADEDDDEDDEEEDEDED